MMTLRWSSSSMMSEARPTSEPVPEGATAEGAGAGDPDVQTRMSELSEQMAAASAKLAEMEAAMARQRALMEELGAMMAQQPATGGAEQRQPLAPPSHGDGGAVAR